MKLNVAVAALASFASLTSVVSGAYSGSGYGSSGQCISTIQEYAGQQQDVNWSSAAGYYTINNNYNNDNAANYNNANNNEQQAEQNAEQAEANIRTQMANLAEVLGIEFDEEQGDNNNQYNEAGDYNQYQDGHSQYQELK